MKKSITSLLKGWCAALLCAGLTLPSFAAADADAAFAAQRHDLKLSLHNAPLREVVTAFTQQTGVVFSYETSLGERTLPHVDVALNGSTLDEMLASVFAGTGISYKIKDKVVALSAPPQSDAPAARSAAQQRKQTVAGRVTDEQGEPLAGVSVLVKNTLTGTSTDADGRYSLSVSGSSAVLVFMYLGFQTLEEEVGARSTLDVTLRENKQILEEVVVVGYGSVKRRDLIGAVDQVDSRQFAERSNPSVSRSLQGAIPNLNISMRDGKPSRAATIDIRGAGSIGSGGGALVLIDGVEGDLETVNPQDIASVSVLKDASSAAIYGARGAFGVILVTTKSASEGEVNVTYSGSFSIHSRTVKPNLVTDGYEWTTGYINAWNGYYNGSKELNSTINNIVPYSDSWYRELARRSTDPSLERVRINDNGKYEYFGNTDWTKAFYKDVNYSHEHNLSISGGGKNADYYVSGRFYDQDGIYRVGDERYKQYNVRAKGSVRIRPWLRLNNNMDFTVVDYHQPMLYYSNQLVPRMVEHSGQPVSLITNPDGTWTYAAVLNGYAGFAEGTSYQQEDKFTLKDKLGVEIDLVKDVLKVSGDLSYLFSRNTRERVTNMYTGYTGPESTITVNESQGSTLQNVRYDMNYVSSNIYAEYTPKLGDDHSLKLLGGWNLEKKKYRTLTVKREGLTVPSKPSFGLMDGVTSDPTVGGYDWSYVGAFFRANYGYKGRYLAEFSCRYDGSSKFPQNSKWGFFPSASVGWRLSEEKFMGWSEGWLDNFKIRLSAGSMGNGNIDPYKYIDYMTLKSSTVVIGNALGTYTVALAHVGDLDHVRRRRRSGPLQEPPDDGLRLVPPLYDRYVHRRREPARRVRHGGPQGQQRLAEDQWLGALRRLARQLQTGRQGVPLRRQGDGLGFAYVGDQIHQPHGQPRRLLRRHGAGRNLGLPCRRAFPRSGRHRLPRHAVLPAILRQGDAPRSGQVRRPERGRQDRSGRQDALRPRRPDRHRQHLGPLPLRHQCQSELERHRHFDLLAGRRQEELVSALRFGLLLGAVQPSVRLHAQGPYGQQRLQRGAGQLGHGLLAPLFGLPDQRKLG